MAYRPAGAKFVGTFVLVSAVSGRRSSPAGRVLGVAFAVGRMSDEQIRP
jgi:hypothetical protein